MKNTYTNPELHTYEFECEEVVVTMSGGVNQNPGGSEGGDTPLMPTSYNSYSI